MLIFRLKIPACVQSSSSMQSATCAKMNSVFSLRSIDPNVSTCSSHKISFAAFKSPCSFLMSERIFVTRARSTSTKILPSVTVRNVSIVDNLVSSFGAESRNPITTCTIFVIACLSWPCFLESNRTCSFSRLQSPESLLSVTIATRIRDVDARSEAWGWLTDGRNTVKGGALVWSASPTL